MSAPYSSVYTTNSSLAGLGLVPPAPAPTPTHTTAAADVVQDNWATVQAISKSAGFDTSDLRLIAEDDTHRFSSDLVNAARILLAAPSMVSPVVEQSTATPLSMFDAMPRDSIVPSLQPSLNYFA